MVDANPLSSTPRAVSALRWAARSCPSVETPGMNRDGVIHCPTWSESSETARRAATSAPAPAATSTPPTSIRPGRSTLLRIQTDWLTSPTRSPPMPTASASSATRRRRGRSSPSSHFAISRACCAARPHGRPEVLHCASTWRTEPMTEINDQDVRDYREEAERTRDEPLSPRASHPSGQRAKVLSVRLNAEEFDELARYAAALDAPASALVRGWILDQLRAGSESPGRTVDRIARELEQLRRQIA